MTDRERFENFTIKNPYFWNNNNEVLFLVKDHPGEKLARDQFNSDLEFEIYSIEYESKLQLALKSAISCWGDDRFIWNILIPANVYWDLKNPNRPVYKNHIYRYKGCLDIRVKHQSWLTENTNNNRFCSYCQENFQGNIDQWACKRCCDNGYIDVVKHSAEVKEMNVAIAKIMSSLQRDGHINELSKFLEVIITTQDDISILKTAVNCVNSINYNKSEISKIVNQMVNYIESETNGKI